MKIGPKTLRTLFAAVALVHAHEAQAQAPRDYASFYENVMGTSLEIRVRATSDSAADAASSALLGEIDRVSSILSGYDAKSELSRWLATKGEPVRVSRELFFMLAESDRWKSASGGGFEPGVQVLTELWTRAAARDRLPAADELAAAVARLRTPAWSLDARNQTAARTSSVPITLNAIAKGYIVDLACGAALQADRGVLGVLANAGGDMTVRGDLERVIAIVSPSADSEGADPLTHVRVKNASIATSGRSQRGFRIQGRWYSHIFDPRTGRPAERVEGASVIAPRGSDADALATILNVLEPAAGVKLVESLPGVECLIVSRQGETSQSRGWSRYVEPQGGAQGQVIGSPASPIPQTGGRGDGPATKPRAKATADELEVAISFETSSPGENRRYRRPYLAVWVEDAEGFPVRTLALWIQTRQPGPRWHPELKRWYKSDQARRLVDDLDMISTVARPTRAPGKYEIVFNGKDDHGKPLDPGEYTVHLEVAREHGTYQTLKKTFSLPLETFREEFKPNAELKSAAIECRGKSKGK